MMASRKGISVGVEITGTAKGFKASAEDAAKASAKMKGKMSKDAGGIGGAFSSMGGVIGRAVRGISDAFKLIIANPVALVLMAVVGAVTALIGAFKSSDKGGTEFAARFEQIKAIIDVVRQRIIAVAEAIGHVFKGEWKEAAASMKEAFTGIGEQIRNATRAAYEYAKAMDVLGDSEQNYISQSAENRRKITILEFTAQDRTKSTAERKAALKEAIAIGETEMKQQKEFAERKLNLEAKYLAEKNGLRAEDVIAFTKMTDEQQSNASAALQTLRNNNEKKLVEIENLYAAWIDLDRKFYEQNKWNIGRLSGFEIEEINKRAAALKALKKVYEDFYTTTRETHYKPPSPEMPYYQKKTKSLITKPYIRYGPLVDASKWNEAELEAKGFSDAIDGQIGIVNDLMSAFENLFANTGKGFKGMAESFGNALRQMAAQLAAKAALFGILTLLTGGSGALAKWASEVLGGRSLGKFMGLANGGIVSGPTLANVGEYAGAKTNPEVVAPLSKLKGLMGAQTMKVIVEGKMRGKDIYFSTMRYAEVLNKST